MPTYAKLKDDRVVIIFSSDGQAGTYGIRPADEGFTDATLIETVPEDNVLVIDSNRAVVDNYKHYNRV
jgi:hypothetical protein